MIIGIDARFYGPKNKGLGRYTQKLIAHLEESDIENQYVIFLGRDNWEDYQPQSSNFKKILADYHWYTLKEQILMPMKILLAKVDLMHFPHFNAPIFCPGKFVVTIHDLILRRFATRRASTHSLILYWLKNLAYRLVIWSAIKRARKIIAVSQFVKKDILKFFKIESKKIKVIYEGVGIEYPFDYSKPGRFRQFLEKYQITKPYLLYVGNAYPHKNLERLLRVFQRLVLRDSLDWQLVLVGSHDYFYQPLKILAFNLNLLSKNFKRVIFTDFVADKELALLYQRAGLYVFPSLCEGFGLPPLEAMSYGLPVLASKATCLPEILGQAAAYFNPLDEDDIYQKLKKFLKSEKDRQKLIIRGRQRIKKYSWIQMAEQTRQVYSMLSGKK